MELDLLTAPSFAELKWPASSSSFTPKKVHVTKAGPYSNAGNARLSNEGYFTEVLSKEHLKHYKQLFQEYSKLGFGQYSPKNTDITGLRNPATFTVCQNNIKEYRKRWITKAMAWIKKEEPLRFNEMLAYDSNGQKADTKPRRNAGFSSSCIAEVRQPNRNTIEVRYQGGNTFYSYIDNTHGKGLEVVGKQPSLGAFFDGVNKCGSKCGISVNRALQRK